VSVQFSGAQLYLLLRGVFLSTSSDGLWPQVSGGTALLSTSFSSSSAGPAFSLAGFLLSPSDSNVSRSPLLSASIYTIACCNSTATSFVALVSGSSAPSVAATPFTLSDATAQFLSGSTADAPFISDPSVASRIQALQIRRLDAKQQVAQFLTLYALLCLYALGCRGCTLALTQLLDYPNGATVFGVLVWLWGVCGGVWLLVTDIPWAMRWLSYNPLFWTLALAHNVFFGGDYFGCTDQGLSSSVLCPVAGDSYLQLHRYLPSDVRWQLGALAAWCSVGIASWWLAVLHVTTRRTATTEKALQPLQEQDEEEEQQAAQHDEPSAAETTKRPAQDRLAGSHEAQLERIVIDVSVGPTAVDERGATTSAAALRPAEANAALIAADNSSPFVGTTSCLPLAAAEAVVEPIQGSGLPLPPCPFPLTSAPAASSLTSASLPFHLQWNGLSHDLRPRFHLLPMSGYISRGEFLAVLGPSGSGKSTLLELIAGRRRSSSGELCLNGSPLSGQHLLSMQRPRVVAFSTGALEGLPQYTVEETLLHNLRLYQPALSARQRSERVEEVLHDLRLGDLRDRRLNSKLSDGERRRLSVGIALLAAAPLLIFDEVSYGLTRAFFGVARAAS
jgi:ABC-type branched-subunit amino acid transport system ATPase component